MSEDPNIQPLNIEEEMKGSYLSYAMSVIIQRALPDVRDGLKPSQRRILVAMNDLNLGPRSKHRKCAKIAGDTSGNYHPHGESVIYPTLVRLAQSFSIRHRLIDGQGNFGSIDGDPPAAMRYTEARMTSETVEMLEDLEKNTVEFIPNYDETRQEPTVLPAKFPNLLVNGGSGIAVGMATNFPPHNLVNVGNAILALLDDPDIDIDSLMTHIPGPDFPTGGIICGRSGILRAYKTGRGIIVMRAKVHTEEMKGDRTRLVVTEIPYQVTKSKLASQIAEGVKLGRLSGISDVRDESDRTGIRLVVDLKRGENDEVILNQLFKHTMLQTSFGIQCIALDKGRPRTLTLKDILVAYRDHRIQIIRRRSLYLLEQAERKAHILRGYLRALDDIDRVIELIRASATVDDARDALIAEFEFTRIQADAILNMRLQRLTGLERQKIEEDLAKTEDEIAYHREVLTQEAKVLGIIRSDVEGMIEKYGNARRTEIIDAVDDIDIEDLISEEQVVVTLSHHGYIKRTPLTTYRSQGRGGTGITGGTTREGDFIKQLFVGSTHDYLLLFTNLGRVYWLKVYAIPDLGRTSRGRAVVNVLDLQSEERIITSIQVREFDDRFVVFATRNGIVKKTALAAFSNPKRTGIIAISIDATDELMGVALVSAGNDVILTTARGMAIRFEESDARAMGRTARGVKGIELSEGDQAVGMAVVEEGGSLYTVSEHGYGKRTLFSAYRSQRRGGKGLIDIRTTERNGRVVAALAVRDEDDVMMMTSGGMLVRIPAGGIRDIGRNTQGVRLIRVKDGDQVIGAEKVEKGKDEPGESDSHLDPGASDEDTAEDRSEDVDRDGPGEADQSGQSDEESDEER